MNWIPFGSSSKSLVILLLESMTLLCGRDSQQLSVKFLEIYLTSTSGEIGGCASQQYLKKNPKIVK